MVSDSVIFHAFLANLSAADDLELLICIGVDCWLVGGRCVCAVRCNQSCDESCAESSRIREAIFLRNDVVVPGYDFWLHRITCYCGRAWAQGNACLVLRSNAGIYPAGFWLCVLPAHACALGLHHLFTFPGIWWRQFCDVYAMATRTVSNRMSGQRFCACDLD